MPLLQGNLRTIRLASWSLHLERVKLFMVGGVVAVLIALRIWGNEVPGAAYLRAFLARGAFGGCIWMAVWGTVMLLRRLVGGTRTRVGAGLLAAFSLGVLANALLTVILAFKYDEAILLKAADAKSLKGFVTLNFANQTPVMLRQRTEGAYEHREPLNDVTERGIQFLMAAEDHRFALRQTGIDLEAIGRAILAWLEGRPLQGASGINAQAAAQLFDIKSGASSWLRWKNKLRKTVIGLRVDDLFTRQEQVVLFLSLSSFGTVEGHEIRGLAAAARESYGVEHTALSDAQLTELLARLKNPNIYFPYQGAGETEQEFAERRTRLLDRAKWILARAEAAGALTSAAREQAEAQLLSGLRSE